MKKIDINKVNEWAKQKLFTAKRYGLFGKSNNTNHQALIVYDPLDNLYR